MKIRKAIIPAAGLGTRFLPATKAMPKEMLPIVDKPTIQYIVEEAIESGIEDIIIVTGKGKRAIEDHFDNSFELEHNLMLNGKYKLLSEVQKSSNMVDIHYIRQKEPKGLGHAVWCARKFIGNEPFAVLLGDDIVQAETPCLRQMIEKFEERKASIIGIKEVPYEEVSRYGIINGEIINDFLYLVSNLIEKPRKEVTPSNLAIMGRYILTPEIFPILEAQETSVGGEIQLTDAISVLTKIQSVFAYKFNGTRYDVGDKFGFLTTNIEFALQNKELKDELLNYLENLLKKKDRKL
ncbi:UTP--glucose-1-phosphate uridylyltransferase GalU [Paenibacillus periandrae]|uniref:UTP--glucose-1-phosphate uridylyltransferase GalU n=1 Tax=Paenibacillus periandrae TaxID=1761741 RepID=UPI001F09EEA7|nr:UTP--glucose-1-phosphate uridylyltransferase GalU [Paenibacillus periandrae]